MKIILLKDVPKIGQKYDIKEVSDGYALNALIPKKLAEKATPDKIAQVEKLKQEMQLTRNTEEQALLKALGEIKGLELVMKAKASDKGHLFSSIRKEDIIEKMKRDYKISLSADSVKIENIKEVGEFEVPVEVGGKKSSFKLLVERE